MSHQLEVLNHSDSITITKLTERARGKENRTYRTYSTSLARGWSRNGLCSTTASEGLSPAFRWTDSSTLVSFHSRATWSSNNMVRLCRVRFSRRKNQIESGTRE